MTTTKTADEIRAELQGINVYLVGMMGTGKTTIGRHLAQLLRYRFFDTDHVAERASGQSVTQLFAASGEAGFRQLETEVLSRICAYQRSVIATGGGIVLSHKNWSYLHYGAVVWLNAPIDVLYERVSRDSSRPLLQRPDPKQALSDILAQRRPLYEQADLRIDTIKDEEPRDVALRLLERLDEIVKPSIVNRSEVNRSET